MLARDANKCKKFRAVDNSLLREILNPLKEDLKLRYSLAIAVVKPGQETKIHTLKVSEVYYILKGRGVMTIGGESQNVGKGYAIYIPPGIEQCIRNTGKIPLEFLCIVDPAWRPIFESIQKKRRIRTT